MFHFHSAATLHGATGEAPGITLTADVPSLTVAAGTSDTVTLTLVRQGGFTDAVALSASGAPAGVTVGFSDASLTDAESTSTVSVTVAAGTTAQSFTLTLTGTPTGLDDVETASVLVTIPLPPRVAFFRKRRQVFATYS